MNSFVSSRAPGGPSRTNASSSGAGGSAASGASSVAVPSGKDMVTVDPQLNKPRHDPGIRDNQRLAMRGSTRYAESLANRCPSRTGVSACSEASIVATPGGSSTMTVLP